MIKRLLCRVNLGHHWLAEADAEGNFRRRCRNCGKYARRGARMGKGSRPADPDSGGMQGIVPNQPFP